jgi:DNA-binding MarR family transcriptional regulator
LALGVNEALERWFTFGLTRLAQAVETAVALALDEEHGLTPADLRVLLVVADAGPFGTRALGERTAIDRTTLATLLASLEEEALVRVETDPTDRRRRVVWATPSTALEAEQASRTAQNAERTALDALERRERTRLAQLVRRAGPRRRRWWVD